MHWRTVILVQVLSILYVVIGGVIYHFVESSNENETREVARQRLLAFMAERPCLNLSTIASISKLLGRAKEAGLQMNQGETNYTYVTNWDIDSSIFLAFQIVGSVGYGNAVPKTLGGRVFCIFFAPVGIPLLLMSGLGIGYWFIDAAERLRKVCFRSAGPKDAFKVHLLRTLIILIALSILFILIPSGIYTAIESRWTYGDALYYCLTTVLTLGFGDYVPGSDWSTEARNLYRLAVGFWLILSLFAFAGLWSSIQISISSTREMQENIEPEADDQPADLYYVSKNVPVNCIQCVAGDKKPQLEPYDRRIFADNAPIRIFNANPYLPSRSSLYSVSVPQGHVTRVSIG